MALTNAERQKRHRQRQAEAAKLGKAIQAEGGGSAALAKDLAEIYIKAGSDLLRGVHRKARVTSAPDDPLNVAIAEWEAGHVTLPDIRAALREIAGKHAVDLQQRRSAEYLSSRPSKRQAAPAPDPVRPAQRRRTSARNAVPSQAA